MEFILVAPTNPYSSPEPIIGTDQRPDKPAGLIRILSGILAASGCIYLVSMIWLIFIPGGLIWLGWVSVAFGKRTLDSPLFWTVSLVWNAGWLVFFVRTVGQPLGGSYHLLIHLIAAVSVSFIALGVRLRQN